MIALIRKLFWFGLFLVATFGFVVLFEHGPANYVSNAKKEFEALKKLYSSQLERKKDDPALGAP